MGLIKRFVEDASRMDRVEWMILGAIFVVVAGGYITATAPSLEPQSTRIEGGPRTPISGQTLERGLRPAARFRPRQVPW